MISVPITSYRLYLFFDVTDDFKPEPGELLVLKNPDGYKVLVIVGLVGSGAVVVEPVVPGSKFEIVDGTVIEPALAGVNWDFESP